MSDHLDYQRLEQVLSKAQNGVVLLALMQLVRGYFLEISKEPGSMEIKAAFLVQTLRGITKNVLPEEARWAVMAALLQTLQGLLHDSTTTVYPGPETIQ
jgi:hypothetical protein